MIANLILKHNNYVCSNCMMRQTGIPSRCYFCGYQFSNWEEIAYNEVMKDVEEERRKNESNLHRTN